MSMEKSEQINELATALAKAQGEIEKAHKDKTNPHFRAQYADLSSCWDACREPLSKNGLAVLQLPTSNNSEGSWVTLRTVLAHSSGQWVASTIEMRPVKNDPQGVGSALTYARRYALMAMVGIAPADDDANAASGKKELRTGPSGEQGLADAVRVAAVHDKVMRGVDAPIAEAAEKIAKGKEETRQKKLRELFAVAKEHGFSEKWISQQAQEKWNLASRSNLSVPQAQSMIDHMRQYPKAKLGSEDDIRDAAEGQ